MDLTTGSKSRRITGVRDLFRSKSVLLAVWTLTSCQLLGLGESEPGTKDGTDTDKSASSGLSAAAETGMARVASSAGRAISYRLSLAQRGNHYLHVDAEFPTEGAAHLDLMLPVWTPGSYLIREYAGKLEGIRARAATGQGNLTVVKTTKNRWRVDSQGASSIVVSYELYCAQASVRSNWVGDERAVIVGAATFLTRVDALGRAHDVLIDMPSEWPHSITGLPPHPDGARHHYRAQNFDILVDSPLVLGRAKISKFEVDGTPHRLANIGGGPMWNDPASAQAVEAIARQAVKFWGIIPYKNYTFLNLIGEGVGGLEHLNSTLMMTSRWSQGLRENFVAWMGLVSHEFFHTWNVKRMRPAPLGPFDYETEAYTRSLWVAEGLTSYYDDLLLVRAGLMTRKEYFVRLGKAIGVVQTTAGRAVQSLENASFDSWVKFYRKDSNSLNSQVSYYGKGSVVGFLLDAKIQRATNGVESLDTAMLRAYAQFSGETGYTPEQFQALMSEVATVDLSTFFSTAVRGTGELEYAEALDWFGLQLGEKSPEETAATAKTTAKGTKPGQVPDAGVSASKKKRPKNEPTPPVDPDPGYLGVRTLLQGGLLKVTHVVRDTPAWLAQLQPQDEVLAIDGYRVTGELGPRLRYYAPGATIEMLVSRHGKLRTLEVTLAKRPETKKKWALTALKKPSPEQRVARDKWLGTAELLVLK